MENTLENAIQFMNDRYGQDIEDILVAYAAPFQSEIERLKNQNWQKVADDVISRADSTENHLLRDEIKQLRAELEAVKVVVPSEEEIQACAVRCAEKDASLTQHEQVFVVAGFYHGAKWMHSQIATAPTGDKSDGG